MGMWDRLLRSPLGLALFTPRVTYVPASELGGLYGAAERDPVKMWKTQPHFRTVVSFLARNVAQLGLHTFERVDENDRRRDRETAVARTLQYVDGTMTRYDLIYALVGDLALFDRAYWLVVRNGNSPSGWVIRRLPPNWVEPVYRNVWELKEYRVFGARGESYLTIPPDSILEFRGYDPATVNGVSPTVDSLWDTLEEQVEAAVYRSSIWKRGGRVSAVLERPVDAPDWSDSAREKFREDWYAKFTGRGSMAGGTPILEDGMTLRRIDFSAQEQQFVEASKLSLQTVAAAFHVNPTMIGQNEGATHSNVREFRKMLYGDTLGPLIEQIQARINSFLLPMMGVDNAQFYTEFNIEEKLQGNFEEQAMALQAGVGAPWMTRNEARALRNLPSVEGGDELITPLNVLIGGQASPQDSGSQNLAAAAALPFLLGMGAPPERVPLEERMKQLPAPGVKAPKRRLSAEEEYAKDVFQNHFSRQRRVIASAIGSLRDPLHAKQEDPTWWDGDRWNRELAEDLLNMLLRTTTGFAEKTLRKLGIDPDEYNPGRTAAFLTKVAERISLQVNTTTKLALIDAIYEPPEDVADEDMLGRASHVFDVAETSRAESSAMTSITTAAGFAVAEAARQTVGPKARKRWVVTSGNPRASHAMMDGEEVPIDETFSNGMMWPGSYDGDVDEVAGCQCELEIVT